MHSPLWNWESLKSQLNHLPRDILLHVGHKLSSEELLGLFETLSFPGLLLGFQIQPGKLKKKDLV